MAQGLGLGVVAFGCLGAGVLTGKYLDDAENAEGRINRRDWPLANTAKDAGVQAIARAVRDIAAELGVTPSQVALAWVKAQHESYIPIFGVRTVQQLQDNLAAVDVALDAAHLGRLDELSRISMGYPWNVLSRIANTTLGGRLSKESASA